LSDYDGISVTVTPAISPVMQDRRFKFAHNGNLYSTIADVLIETSDYNWDSQNYYRHIPGNWSIAKYDSDSKTVASEKRFSTEFLVRMCTTIKTIQKLRRYKY
jgi:hypothetical protein